MGDKNTSNIPTNFIRNIINNDLNSGLYSSIQTRFPPEAITGHSGKWYRHIQPSPWIKDYWVE